MNDAYDGPLDQPAAEQIEAAEHSLYQLAEEGRVDPGGQQFAAPLTSAVEMIKQAYQRDSRLTGAPTGFVDLDRLLGGLHASDLIILASRPGMGKTALATNISFSAASTFSAGTEGGPAADGARVAFFSLEMSAEQLATRILAEQTEISSDKLRRGEVRDADFVKIVQASQAMEALPLFIDDTPALTIAGLRARARRLKRRHGISLIVVDYLQLMRPTTSIRLNNRVQEVSEITQGLKALAKDLDLPVLALAQLSRAVEQRDDKRPQLADLRESGSIEQDADVVMFLYREQYYLGRKEPEEGTADHAEWQEKDGQGPQQGGGHHRQAAPRADRQDRALFQRAADQVRQSRQGPRVGRRPAFLVFYSKGVWAFMRRRSPPSWEAGPETRPPSTSSSTSTLSRGASRMTTAAHSTKGPIAMVTASPGCKSGGAGVLTPSAPVASRNAATNSPGSG